MGPTSVDSIQAGFKQSREREREGLNNGHESDSDISLIISLAYPPSQSGHEQP